MRGCGLIRNGKSTKKKEKNEEKVIEVGQKKWKGKLRLRYNGKPRERDDVTGEVMNDSPGVTERIGINWSTAM